MGSGPQQPRDAQPRPFKHFVLAVAHAGRSAAQRATMSSVAGKRMVPLGFGTYVRADRVYALQPVRGDDRNERRRTLVWVEGITEPLVASRTERTILADMGEETGVPPLLDEALDLAQRLASAADAGRVDLHDLGRRARRLLAATTAPPADD